jgi:hypothetical protein
MHTKHDPYSLSQTVIGLECLTNDLSDFSRKPTRCNRSVLGVSKVPTSITHRGEATDTVTDDLGRDHKLVVPEIYYCPTLPYRVLSPQSLDRQWRAKCMGTISESTNSNKTVLQWTSREGKQYSKSIIHSPRSAVPRCS